MKKIDYKVRNAWNNNKSFKSSNTTIISENGELSMYLFGNKIAELYDGNLHINHCGHKTQTTVARLNAICSIRLRRCKGEIILNEKSIMENGWTNLSEL